MRAKQGIVSCRVFLNNACRDIARHQNASGQRRNPLQNLIHAADLLRANTQMKIRVLDVPQDISELYSCGDM